MSDDMMKVAAQYDAAGRFMAHGFVDEFNKLAYNLELEKEAGFARRITRAATQAAKRGSKKSDVDLAERAIASGSKRLGGRARAAAAKKARRRKAMILSGVGAGTLGTGYAIRRATS